MLACCPRSRAAWAVTQTGAQCKPVDASDWAQHRHSSAPLLRFFFFRFSLLPPSSAAAAAAPSPSCRRFFFFFSADASWPLPPPGLPAARKMAMSGPPAPSFLLPARAEAEHGSKMSGGQAGGSLQPRRPKHATAQPARSQPAHP